MAQIWSAKNKMEGEDVWDDTELIKMYDESIQEAYAQSTGVTEKTYKGHDGQTYTWKVGGHCMAPYEENGSTSYFAATIDYIGGKDNLEVQVTFLYYGGQATVHMKDIFLDEKAINEGIAYEAKARAKEKSSRGRYGTNSSYQSSSNPSAPIPNFAPPIPPNVIAMAPADQQEALSSMLMSWYMSGYHTGYYQAMTDKARKN